MLAIFVALQIAAQTAAIAQPVTLTNETAVHRPTAAARALSMEGVTAPPTPIRFRFQCLVWPKGLLSDCILANDGGTQDPAVFRERLYAEIAQTDPIRKAARARLSFWYARDAPERKKALTRSVFVDETVSANDLPPTNPGLEIARTDLTVELSSVEINTFYPPAALRAGAAARMAAKCRVLEDLSLWCRNARIALTRPDDPPPAWRQPSLDPAFAKATERAFATMHVAPKLVSGGSSVGRETELALNWLLPY